MTRRVLVTGASGFIGRQAVPLLVEQGYEVHAVSSSRERIDAGSRSTESDDAGSRSAGSDHAGPQSAGSDHVAVSWHTADLLNAEQVDALIAGVRPTHLLHFAWFAKPGEFWNSSENPRWSEASRSLLQAFRAAGGERAVLAGTCAEYSWGSEEPLDELTSPREPATIYGAEKESLRKFTEQFASESGLSSAWGEIFFLYGPYEYPQRLVASVVRALVNGEVAKTSHGQQVRDFLHVRDVAAAFTALLASDVTGPVNIGSGEVVTIAEVVQLIGDVVGRPDLLQIGALAASPDEPKVIRPRVDRLNLEVGWRPSLSLEAGIEDTIAYWHRMIAS